MQLWTIQRDYEKEMDREINFKVRRSWLNKWFKENRKGQETNGNIEKDTYEFLQDFLNDYVLEDSIEVYQKAEREDAILEITPLEDWYAI